MKAHAYLTNMVALFAMLLAPGKTIAQVAADRNISAPSAIYFWATPNLSGSQFSTSLEACNAAKLALGLTVSIHLKTNGAWSDKCMLDATDPAWTGGYTYSDGWRATCGGYGNVPGFTLTTGGAVGVVAAQVWGNSCRNYMQAYERAHGRPSCSYPDPWIYGYYLNNHS